MVGPTDQILAMGKLSGSASGELSTSPGRKMIKNASGTTAIPPYDIFELRSRRRVSLTSGENSFSSTSYRSSESDSVVTPAAANCPTGSDVLISCSPSSSEDVKDCMEVTSDIEVESSLTSSKFMECRSVGRGENEKNVKPLKSEDLELKPTVQIKMPSNSEIEDFFAAAEKDIQKKFTENYNFDIVKDVPLKGRYEWLPNP